MSVPDSTTNGMAKDVRVAECDAETEDSATLSTHRKSSGRVDELVEAAASTAAAAAATIPLYRPVVLSGSFTRLVKRQLRARVRHRFRLCWPTSHDRAHEATRVLSLSADPFCATTSPPSHRRVALLLSSGDSLMLPLIAVRKPVSLPYSAKSGGSSVGQCFWHSKSCECTEGKSMKTSTTTSTPTTRISSSSSSSLLKMHETGCSDRSAASSATLVIGALEQLEQRWCDEAVWRERFFSIPYKVLWSTTRSNRLWVSLPCEERVVTLCVDYHALPTHEAAGYARTGKEATRDDAPLAASSSSSSLPIDQTQWHTFPLLRGVIPLDLAEVCHGAAVAVGTWEHGVMVCAVHVHTAALLGVLHLISPAGVGCAHYPITKLAAVPSMRSTNMMRAMMNSSRAYRADTENTLHANDGQKSSVSDEMKPGPSAQAASVEALLTRDCMSATLTALSGSMFCLSSVYDLQSALVDLWGGAALVTRVNCFNSSNHRSDVAVTTSSSCSSTTVETILHAAPYNEHTGLLVTTSAHKLLCLTVHEPTGRLCVQRLLTLPLGGGMLRSAEGCAVLQERTYKNHYTRVTSETKHWMMCADAENRIYLLDRNPSRYSVHSSVMLTPLGEGATSPTAGSAAARSNHNRTLCIGSSLLVEQERDGQSAQSSCGDKAKKEQSSNSWGTIKKTAGKRVGGTVKYAAVAKLSQRRATKTMKSCVAAATQRARGQCSHKRSAALASEDDGGENEECDAIQNAGDAKRASERFRDVAELVSGLFFLDASDDDIWAVAAHDRNCISLIAWSVT